MDNGGPSHALYAVASNSKPTKLTRIPRKKQGAGFLPGRITHARVNPGSQITSPHHLKRWNPIISSVGTVKKFKT